MTTLSEKKSIVSDFLLRCNRYADDKLAGFAAELERSAGLEALAIQDEISHWTAYKAFNEYALAELETEELDAWFE
jgi:hypothetical protein